MQPPAFSASTLDFASAVTYASGGYNADSVAVADVNGDGKPDLLLANYCFSSSDCTTGGVDVLLGNGDGTFQTAVSYATGGGGADSLAVADVNGDGKPDLLVVTGGGVGVLLGNGDGTFQTAVGYGSGGYGSLAVADVNGDGKLDLVASSQCLSSSFCNGRVGSIGGVSVLLGNGDGTFQTAVSYGTIGFDADSVAVADVNGDGKPDLLVANSCASPGSCGPGSVVVLLGNGDGTFQTAVSYSSGGFYAYSMAVADVNGDGKPDLVVLNECLPNGGACNGALGVLLGNGDGTFQTAGSYGSGGFAPGSMAVADVNGDGRPDLLVAIYCATTSDCGGVGILLGNGDGTFQTAVSYDSGGNSANSLTVADVNGDGRPDLLVSECNTVGCSPVGVVGVLINTSTTATTTALISSPNPSNFGQAVTLTATVTDQPGFSKSTPTGTATFYEGTSNIGSSNLNGSGVATLTTSTVGIGTHSITASYGSDTNSASSTSTVLNQVVQGAIAVASPTSLNFGNQSVGLPSVVQAVSLMNSGNIPLTLTISIVGANSGDFSQTNNCGSSVAASGSCTINITLTPSVLGTRTAEMSITDNATDSPQMVALTGVGVPSPVTLSPASITFPPQYVGTSGLPQAVTLTNNGTSAVSVTSVTTSPADFAPLNSCGSSVAPAASCSIGIFFDPTASGVRSGTLTVIDSASATAQTVSLSGTAQDFSMAPSGSSSATVSQGQTANYGITIAPVGGFNQQVSFTCSGAPAQSTCSLSPTSVNLNGSSSITVNVQVTTAANSASLARPLDVRPAGNRLALWLALSGPQALALVGIYVGSRRHRKRALYALALLCVLSAGIGLSACGSSRNSGGGGTPAGTYTISVTGSFSSNATSLNHTTKLTLIVQ